MGTKDSATTSARLQVERLSCERSGSCCGLYSARDDDHKRPSCAPFWGNEQDGRLIEKDGMNLGICLKMETCLQLCGHVDKAVQRRGKSEACALYCFRAALE
jgi:hypothetical protein